MKDYVARMLQEHSDLNDKVTKLSEFMKSEKYSALSDEQKDLLNAQYHAMSSYLFILARRIDTNM